jgi:glycosyltransferase involved in cell wall biosynthesis
MWRDISATVNPSKTWSVAKVLLTGSRNIIAFNTPRASRHTLLRSRSVPLARIWRPLDGLGMWVPVRSDYQLIHSANRIPLVDKPFVVTFESFLPRTLGVGGARLKKLLRKRLAGSNCRHIIAMSDYARRKFVADNDDWPLLEETFEKLLIVPPNVPLRVSEPKTWREGESLRLVFVGHDFARKGGVVALRLAKKARAANLPVTVHVVSSLNYGAGVYTDFPDGAKYERDLEMLHLSNVVFHGTKTNQEVLRLLSQSHFQIMATLDDTYGFSVIEGFSVGTPAITTNVCALPEFVHHGSNGYLLRLDLNSERKWSHLRNRRQADYWEILDSTYDDLAEQALRLLQETLTRFTGSNTYEILSANSLGQVRRVHDAGKAGQLLDDIYTAAVSTAT